MRFKIQCVPLNLLIPMVLWKVSLGNEQRNGTKNARYRMSG